MKSLCGVKTSTLFIIGILVSVVFMGSVQPSYARFVLASWDYPDDYGQGIENIELYENSTGSWLEVGSGYGFDEAHIYEWPVGVAIRINCFTWFNSTLTGAGTITEGKLYQQHNVSVSLLGETIFSQQNFTYIDGDNGIDPPQWFYEYEIILNFIPTEASYYTVTIIYEVFYL